MGSPRGIGGWLTWERGDVRVTGMLPAVPLSRPPAAGTETGNFASPPRSGFALFGGRRSCL